MNINEYMQAYQNITKRNGYEYRKNAPHIVCPDGFNMSVQVSETRYEETIAAVHKLFEEKT